MIDLRQNLNLACIVEGMETEARVRVLHDTGRTTMRGYVFGMGFRRRSPAALQDAWPSPHAGGSGARVG